MNCRNHPDRDAVDRCIKCGAALCGDCAIVLSDGAWCARCIEAAVRTGARVPRWRDSPLIAALLSIIPGVGHMYLGLIGKGSTLLGVLISTLFLILLYADATGMYWIVAFLVPTISVLFVSYSIFDSMGIASAVRGGRDRDASVDRTMEAIWNRLLRGGRTVGYLIAGAGVIGILKVLDAPFRALLPRLPQSLTLTGIVIPIVLLVVGIYLIRRAGER